MIEILKYNDNMSKDWDLFVSSSFNGTIFHQRQFLSYHKDRKFEDCSLLFKKRGKIIALIPAATIKRENKITFSSHPGASFGGIVHGVLSFADCDKIIELIESYCKKNDYNNIFIVQTPTIYNSIHQNEMIDYVLKINNYQNHEYYISNILPIEKDTKSQLLKIFKNKNRTISYYEGLVNNYNLTFKWVDNFEDFYPILLKNKKKHNSKPTHSQEELKILKSRFPNEILQLMLYSNNIPIAGMTIFKPKHNTNPLPPSYYLFIDWS